MRLRRLDLTRYGKFSDTTLDFGPCNETRADFHLVYGGNEAGKSTALSAYMDLLFGIDKRSTYDFLHDYKSMQIGGVLEVPGETLSLIRTKGNKDTLRDSTGQIVDPARLAALLHGLDRDAYGAMFCLDGARLESGGEEILASKGELGRILFSAASGMADVSGALSGLSEQARKFYRPRATKVELTELKKQLKALDDERKTLDTQATEYDRLRTTLAEAQHSRDAVRDRREDLRREKNRLDALKSAYPVAQNLKELWNRAKELAPYPPFEDASLSAEIEALKSRRIEALTKVETATQQMARVDVALGALTQDPGGLALAERLEALDSLRTRYRGGIADLKRIQDDRENIDKKLASLIATFGLAAETNSATLVLPADAIADLTALIADHGLLTQQKLNAKAEADAAEKALEALVVADIKTELAAVDTDTLSPLFKRIRGDDVEARLGLAEAAVLRANEQANRLLQALAPWSGTVEALPALPCPALDQAIKWRDRVREIADERATLDARLVEDVELLAQTVAMIERMIEGGGVISDSHASEVRATRDAAWQAHRKALDAESADQFEEALRTDDAIQSDRIAQSDRLASLRELEQKRAALEAGTAAAKARSAQLETAATDVAARMAGPLRAAGLPESFDPLALPGWLDRFAKAEAAANEVQAAHRERDSATRGLATHRETLRAALAELGATFSDGWALHRLLDKAEALVERAKSEQAAHASHASAQINAKRHVERRQTALSVADDQLSDWNVRWRDALAGSWLEGRTPVQVSALLDPLRALPGMLDQRTEFERRIKGMQRDISAFRQALDTDSEDDPETQFTALTARLQTARQAKAEHARLTRDRGGIDADRIDANAQLVAVQARTTEIAARFSEDLALDNLDALAQAVTFSAAHHALKQDIGSAERALTDLLNCGSPEAAMVLLDETSLADTVAALADHDPAAAQADSEWQESIVAHRDADRAVQAVGGDAAVAQLEEQRTTLLLDIGERAEIHLRLTLGVMAAERALRLYRDRHRSAMMASTGTAFQAMTQGAYAKLETVPDGDTERLITRRADTGASVGVEAMSTATRHQLFLALRVAGYEAFCHSAGSLPLIADDILESFDDNRAAEAFSQLRSLARHGQAIYLTHHRHLSGIAAEVCGEDVQIHML